jgi:hypothetical protein
MKDLKEIQQFFFQQIKDKLPPHLSLVDEIAEKLGLSYDSAYRRMRGEKSLSFEEVMQLASHFSISLDSLGGIASDTISFRYRTINDKTFTFTDYLQAIDNNLTQILKIPGAEMFYAAKDTPLFHHFNMKELSAFKIFAWEKTILGFEKMENRRFRLDECDYSQVDLGRQGLLKYMQVPSVEIWNDETINSTIRQIDFYHESGLFIKKEEAGLIVDQLLEWLLHMQKQAEVGYKFLYGTEPQGKEGNYQLYNNEVILCDNTVLVDSGTVKTAFITHNAMNYMVSSNVDFCDVTYKWLRNLMKRSTLISSVSEKQRNRFFRVITDRVQQLKTRVS